MTTNENGPVWGRSDLAAAKQFDMTKATSSGRLLASLAYAMYLDGSDADTIAAAVGQRAARLAREVQAYDVALGHLRDLGLVGIEPTAITTIRHLSRRWSE